MGEDAYLHSGSAAEETARENAARHRDAAVPPEEKPSANGSRCVAAREKAY